MNLSGWIVSCVAISSLVLAAGCAPAATTPNEEDSAEHTGVGSGLGLAISHTIIAAHGGQITVESIVGKGTVFRIRLPPARPTPRPQQSKPPEPAIASPRARILVIDDDENVGRVLVRMLKDEHEVVFSSSARQAIVQLERGAVFDVILCDLMMPDMTGMDFYEWIEVHQASLAKRVLFTTGGAATTRARAFGERLTGRVVPTPFDRGQLLKTISELLARGAQARR